ncbi:MAG: phage minor capsid protein [Clostridia bacterium]|nr:phage minor capsid protein [Clostridia bacterium]
MKEEVYVSDPLNGQASVFVDAQTDIKTAIKQTILSDKGKEEVKAQVKKIIDRAIARIRSPTLKEDGRISLMRFADKAYMQFVTDLQSIAIQLLPAVVILMRGITAKEQHKYEYFPSTATERKAALNLGYAAYNKGIPLQEFQKRYIERVDKALENLAEINALDPNDFTGRNSLRNLAEMQVRYERHQDEIEGFKQRGTRLVVCSVHADCSDRCSHWQGGVYSLDGTSGITDDGKRFQPLENATDVYYTTKAGRTYKNGLLGFNCRHKLFEYKVGMVVPTVSEDERKRENAITRRQRELERDVISARENALTYKGVNTRLYNKWRDIARKRYDVYKHYSESNGRAYYPDRVKIL